MITPDINPKKIYNLKELHEQRLIPWAVHYNTLRKIISLDFSNRNILNISRSGKGRQMRYGIRGSNIIKYINYYGGAMTMTARKTNQKIWQKSKKVFQ